MTKTITAENYPGRKWTCSSHHEKILEAIANGASNDYVTGLVMILNPKKSRGICQECKRLYWETLPEDR